MDKRQTPITIEEYRECLVPSYQSLTMALMGGYQSQIRVHDFNTDKVITKKDILDSRSIVPTVFNTEMTEVNHAKFYPIGQTFAAVGMYLGFRTSQMQNGNRQSCHNAIIRELTIAWDRMAMVGGFGNKGLLKSYADDPLRVTMADVTLPKASETFEARAKAVKDMGLAIKESIDSNSASDSVTVLVYGKDLQAYLTDANTATDATTLRSYLIKGFGTKYVNVIDVPALLTKDTDLADANGLAIIANGTMEMDTTEYPDLDKIGSNESESGDFDWSRFKIGSVQLKPGIQGGITNLAVKFAA